MTSQFSNFSVQKDTSIYSDEKPKVLVVFNTGIHPLTLTYKHYSGDTTVEKEAKAVKILPNESAYTYPAVVEASVAPHQQAPDANALVLYTESCAKAE